MLRYSRLFYFKCDKTLNLACVYVGLPNNMQIFYFQLNIKGPETALLSKNTPFLIFLKYVQNNAWYEPTLPVDKSN